MKRFKWNKDTLEYFKTINKEYPQFVGTEVRMFVKNDCDLEDGETYEDLVNDLINQIQTKYDN